MLKQALEGEELLRGAVVALLVVEEGEDLSGPVEVESGDEDQHVQVVDHDFEVEQEGGLVLLG